MLKELQVVMAKIKLSENVDKGSVGTIVYVYSLNDFEVEFLDKEGYTLDILTVSYDDIELIS